MELYNLWFMQFSWIMNYCSVNAARVTGYPQGGYHGHLGTTTDISREGERKGKIT